MAERRMFHTTVVESDAFLDLPLQAQALYFHLGMYADNDGFVNSPRQIARKIRVPVTRLKQLVDTGFLLELDDIVVLRHWRVANTLRKARIKPPQYPDLARKLYIRENGIYTCSPDAGGVTLWEERMSLGCPLDDQWMPNIKEENIKENNINEYNIIESNVTDTAAAVSDAAGVEIHSGFYKEKSDDGVIHLSPKQTRELVEMMGLDAFADYVGRLANFIRDNEASVKNHYTTIRKWWKEDQGL